MHSGMAKGISPLWLKQHQTVKKNQAVALAVDELCQSEGISKVRQLINQ